MHIRSGEPSTGTSTLVSEGRVVGGVNEAGPCRKPRLGTATRILTPSTQKKATDSTLRTLVSAIGQSLGSRTPSRVQYVVGSSASKSKKITYSALSLPVSSSPAESGDNSHDYSSSGRMNTNLSSTARLTGSTGSSKVLSAISTSSKTTSISDPSTFGSSKLPLTPRTSRLPATSDHSSKSSTPANSARELSISNPSRVITTPLSRMHGSPGIPWRSSLSNTTLSAPSISHSTSSTPSISAINSHSTANPAKQQTVSRTSAKTNTTSTAVRQRPDTGTPVTNCNTLTKSPKAQGNFPTTPPSKSSCISLRTPRRLTGSSTPGPKPTFIPGSLQTFTPGPTKSKSFFPTTPVAKSSCAPDPTTPGNNENAVGTPQNKNPSTPSSFFTPKSTLRPSPLRPKNHNTLESSRQLQFGNHGAVASDDQENMGNKTPKPYQSPLVAEATFSFDKQRLAQINARRNAAQSIRSPAERVRAGDKFQRTQNAGRSLQQVAEDRSARFDHIQVASCIQSPPRRRVANSLF